MHICSHKINDVGKKNQRTYHERFIQIQFKITIALFKKENKKNIIKYCSINMAIIAINKR